MDRRLPRLAFALHAAWPSARALVARPGLAARCASRPRACAGGGDAAPAAAGGRPLRKNDVMDVRIESLAYGGAGVAKVPAGAGWGADDEGMLVYTPKGAAPGDLLRVVVKQVRRRPAGGAGGVRKSVGDVERAAGGRAYVEALFVERLQVSAAAVAVPCRHFGNARLGGGSCGGCLTMDVAYEGQLAEKQAQARLLFEGVAEVAAIVPCDRLVGYRNKMEFSYGRKWFVGPAGPAGGERKAPMAAMDAVGSVQKQRRGGRGAPPAAPVPRAESDREYALGMHAPGRYDRVVEITECHLQEPVANEVLALVRRRCEESGFLAYDAVDHSGLVRNVGIRSARNGAGALELMVNLQTSPCEVPARLVPLAEELVAAFPAVVAVVQNMPSAAGNSAMDPARQRLLAGARSHIEQRLCGLTFEISANSFFQTNPSQAERLYEEARRAADLRPDDVVLDLFCGTGTIGLSMARFCRTVVGYELVADAVADAKRNARRNGITNVRFVEGNLERARDLPVETICGEDAVDVIVLDPPRSGVGPRLTKELARTTARRIVYISCNPATCARDLAYLAELAPGRFAVDSVVPVDMFPHTPHIEVVASVSVDPGVPPLPRRVAAAPGAAAGGIE